MTNIYYLKYSNPNYLNYSNNASNLNFELS